jgi:hypothetical protein
LTEDEEDEIAFQVAINALRDSVESGKMSSGMPLTPEASQVHERVAQRLEHHLRQIPTAPHHP